MKYSDSLNLITELTSDQWGLITNQQAEGIGISRLKLSRLAADGILTRVRPGVYLDSAVPLGDETYIRAQWLSFRPDILASTRLKRPEQDVIVAGHTASWLYGAGNFLPSPQLFYATERYQKQSQGVKVLRRELQRDQIRIFEGLPLTGPEQTIHDLLLQGTDLESVKTAVSDMVVVGLDLDRLLAPMRDISRKIGLETSVLNEILAEASLNLSQISLQLKDAIKNQVQFRESIAELQVLQEQLATAIKISRGVDK